MIFFCFLYPLLIAYKKHFMSQAKTIVSIFCLFLILLVSCDKHHDPKNMIPVANAGPSKTIVIKVAKSDTTTLTGTVLIPMDKLLVIYGARLQDRRPLKLVILVPRQPW